MRRPYIVAIVGLGLLCVLLTSWFAYMSTITRYADEYTASAEQYVRKLTGSESAYKMYSQAPVLDKKVLGSLNASYSNAQKRSEMIDYVVGYLAQIHEARRKPSKSLEAELYFMHTKFWNARFKAYNAASLAVYENITKLDSVTTATIHKKRLAAYAKAAKQYSDNLNAYKVSSSLYGQRVVELQQALARYSAECDKAVATLSLTPDVIELGFVSEVNNELSRELRNIRDTYQYIVSFPASFGSHELQKRALFRLKDSIQDVDNISSAEQARSLMKVTVTTDFIKYIRPNTYSDSSFASRYGSVRVLSQQLHQLIENAEVAERNQLAAKAKYQDIAQLLDLFADPDSETDVSLTTYVRNQIATFNQLSDKNKVAYFDELYAELSNREVSYYVRDEYKKIITALDSIQKELQVQSQDISRLRKQLAAFPETDDSLTQTLEKLNLSSSLRKTIYDREDLLNSVKDVVKLLPPIERKAKDIEALNRELLLHLKLLVGTMQ